MLRQENQLIDGDGTFKASDKCLPNKKRAAFGDLTNVRNVFLSDLLNCPFYHVSM